MINVKYKNATTIYMLYSWHGMFNKIFLAITSDFATIINID